MVHQSPPTIEMRRLRMVIDSTGEHIHRHQEEGKSTLCVASQKNAGRDVAKEDGQHIDVDPRGGAKIVVVCVHEWGE